MSKLAEVLARLPEIEAESQHAPNPDFADMAAALREARALLGSLYDDLDMRHCGHGKGGTATQAEVQMWSRVAEALGR